MFSAILEKKWLKLLEKMIERFRAIINKERLMYYLFYGSLKIQKHINTLSKLLKNIEIYLSHLKHKRIDYTGKTIIDFNNLNNAKIHAIKKTL